MNMCIRTCAGIRVAMHLEMSIDICIASSTCVHMHIDIDVHICVVMCLDRCNRYVVVMNRL